MKNGNSGCAWFVMGLVIVLIFVYLVQTGWIPRVIVIPKIEWPKIEFLTPHPETQQQPPVIIITVYAPAQPPVVQQVVVTATPVPQTTIGPVITAVPDVPIATPFPYELPVIRKSE